MAIERAVKDARTIRGRRIIEAPTRDEAHAMEAAVYSFARQACWSSEKQAASGARHARPCTRAHRTASRADAAGR